MSEAALHDPDSTTAEPERLVSVTMGDWPPLGGTVELGIAPRRTVLVGKNGSGKSLLLEGCMSVVEPLDPREGPRGPAHWGMQLGSPGGGAIRYEYHLTAVNPEDSALRSSMPAAPRYRRSERCWQVATGAEV